MYEALYADGLHLSLRCMHTIFVYAYYVGEKTPASTPARG